MSEWNTLPAGAPITSQGRTPAAPVGDTPTGSLYGVTVGETDSDDVEWQPQSGNASSDHWSTDDEDEGDGDNSSLEGSGNESSGDQPGTSDGRREAAPPATSQQEAIQSVLTKVNDVIRMFNGVVPESNEPTHRLVLGVVNNKL